MMGILTADAILGRRDMGIPQWLKIIGALQVDMLHSEQRLSFFITLYRNILPCPLF
jgi:hypothetical protein